MMHKMEKINQKLISNLNNCRKAPAVVIVGAFIWPTVT